MFVIQVTSGGGLCSKPFLGSQKSEVGLSETVTVYQEHRLKSTLTLS